MVLNCHQLSRTRLQFMTLLPCQLCAILARIQCKELWLGNVSLSEENTQPRPWSPLWHGCSMWRWIVMLLLIRSCYQPMTARDTAPSYGCMVTRGEATGTGSGSGRQTGGGQWQRIIVWGLWCRDNKGGSVQTQATRVIVRWWYEKYRVFKLKKSDSTLCFGDFLWYSEAVFGVKSSSRVGALTFRQENWHSSSFWW